MYVIKQVKVGKWTLDLYTNGDIWVCSGYKVRVNQVHLLENGSDITNVPQYVEFAYMSLYAWYINCSGQVY